MAIASKSGSNPNFVIYNRTSRSYNGIGPYSVMGIEMKTPYLPLTDKQRQMCLASFLVVKKLYPGCKAAQIAATNGIKLLDELRQAETENISLGKNVGHLNQKIHFLKGKQ